MTPAITAAEKAGVDYSVIEYEPTAGAESYGLEAANVMGQPPERVFKTLVAKLDGTRLVVAMIPVDRRLDLKALAASLGAKKGTMAETPEAERATGYVVGGISPLGQRRRLPAVLDSSAMRHERVFVSGGRRGLELALAPGDLVRLCGATLARVAR